MMFLLLFSLFLYSITKAEVLLQQTSPSYHPVCPGDNVTITCDISTGSTLLIWTDPLNASAPSIIFLPSTNIEATVGNFRVRAVDNDLQNIILSSEAIIQNIELNKNGSSLNCSDQTSIDPMTISVLISSEIPNSPSNVSFTAHTTTHLTLYWSPPTENSNCIAKYIVKINDWQMETTVTSLSVPNLSIGSVYNITVYGQLQDSVNRNGSTSELFVVTWKAPLPVSNLLWCIIDGNTNTSIMVTWNHEEDSSRPPTQHFLISHNISEPWTTTTMNSSIILTVIKRGNTYVIYVSAFNIFGESLPKEINVHITNTDETTVTTHTGMTSVLTNHVISSTFQELSATTYEVYEHTRNNSASSSDYKPIVSLSTLITSVTITDNGENTLLPHLSCEVTTCIIGSTLGIVISTIVSVIVTSLVCLLITQKRIQQYKTLPEHKLQDPVNKTGPVYDIPDMNIIKPVQDTFELQTNTAYGTVNN